MGERCGPLQLKRRLGLRKLLFLLIRMGVNGVTGVI